MVYQRKFVQHQENRHYRIRFERAYEFENYLNTPFQEGRNKNLISEPSELSTSPISPQSRKIDIIEDYGLKVLTLRLSSRAILREKNTLVDINAKHAYIIN